MSNIRQMLVELCARVDVTKDATLQAQAASVNVPKLEEAVQGLVDRTVVLTHALDVFKNGTFGHPLPAIVYAMERLWPEATDKEFLSVLSVWSRLVGADTWMTAPGMGGLGGTTVQTPAQFVNEMTRE